MPKYVLACRVNQERPVGDSVRGEGYHQVPVSWHRLNQKSAYRACGARGHYVGLVRGGRVGAKALFKGGNSKRRAKR
jgi:hypothetical protein